MYNRVDYVETESERERERSKKHQFWCDFLQSELINKVSLLQTKKQFKKHEHFVGCEVL